MKHKDYVKLMKTPMEELSAEDQAIRKKEFARRLDVCKMFLSGLVEGHISEDISGLMEDDDSIREIVEYLKIRVNDRLETEA